MRRKRIVTPEIQSAIAGAFAGQSVSQLRFDYAVTILGDKGDLLTFKRDFDLVTSTGETQRSAYDDGRPVETLVGLLHQAVTAVQVTDGGMLNVSFEGGCRIAAGPDQQYEAWTLNVQGGALYACAPGGEIRDLGDGTDIPWYSYSAGYPYGSHEARDDAREILADALESFPAQPINAFFGELMSSGYEVVERERVIPEGYAVVKQELVIPGERGSRPVRGINRVLAAAGIPWEVFRFTRRQ